MADIFLYYFKTGGIEFLAPFFVVFLFYIVYKILYDFLSQKLYGKPFSESTKKFIKNIFIIFIVFAVFFFIVGVLIDFVTYRATEQKIIYFNNLFMQFDKNFFGIYLPFWLQNSNNTLKPVFDFLALPIIYSYAALAFLLGGFFVVFLAIKPSYFYKMSIAFAFTLLLAIPLWFLFPATSPFDAYVDNIVKMPNNNDINFSLSNYEPNKKLQNSFDRLKKINKESRDKFFAITSFPSMHIAWSLLFVCFGIWLYKPLAIFLIPYFVLNATATLYLLQHYTADIFSGLVVGVLSIYLSLKMGEKTPKFIVDISNTVKDDFKSILKDFKMIFS